MGIIKSYQRWKARRRAKKTQAARKDDIPRPSSICMKHTLPDGETAHIMWKTEFLDGVREDAEKLGVTTSDLLQEHAEALSEKLKSLNKKQETLEDDPD